MSLIALLSGLLVGVLASGLLFSDTSRRNLKPRVQYLWTGGVGIVSVGAPLTAHFFDSVLYQLYFGRTDSPAIALLPREVAAAFLVIALAADGGAVLAYGFDSRYGPLKVS